MIVIYYDRRSSKTCIIVLTFFNALAAAARAREDNAIEHALIVEMTNIIQLSSLPLLFNQHLRKIEATEFLPLRCCEKEAIQDALARSHGVKKRAAELLGIHPKNLSQLLRKHKLCP